MIDVISLAESQSGTQKPACLDTILSETKGLGFTMASELALGPVLALLAASKPAGNLLELGTGTGLGTAWLLSGMTQTARLTSVESDPEAANVARRHLGTDSRLDLGIMDGESFLSGADGSPPYDLIFADTWPGKFTLLEQTLGLLAPGGLYVVDDLLAQETWPEGHDAAVEALCGTLAAWPGGRFARLDWASGIGLLVATERFDAEPPR